MPTPNTNFFGSDGIDIGRKLVTKEYLISVYPQLVAEVMYPELWCWGRNDALQLGTNDSIERSTPITTFSGGSNWMQCSSNTLASAAIKVAGSLWVWGAQTGDNTSQYRSTPVTVFGGGTNWKQVSVGGGHFAAIKTDGTLWLWGDNSFGQLGVTGPTRLTPVQVTGGGVNWKQVSCGQDHTAAIKTDGTLWIWGGNSTGQLGTNDLVTRTTPVQTFGGGTGWKQVSCGFYYTLGVFNDGRGFGWGFNPNGALGNNSTQTFSQISQIAGPTNWKQLSAGTAFSHSAGITKDGRIWTWGANSNGQLGINSTGSKLSPTTTFGGGTNWKQVSVGNGITAAIKTDGSLWVWGNGVRLGINRTGATLTPVTTFLGRNTWKQVSTAADTILAIQSIDTL